MFHKNLESLRGIAALMVALSHCLLVLNVDGIDNIWFATFDGLNGTQSAITRGLLIPFNGGAAVIVFFVLSGYVLGLSLDKHRLGARRVSSFYLKRIFRLYPAHIAVLAVIVPALYLFHKPLTFDAASAWFAQWYTSGMSWGQVLSNASLARVDLNHIAWSLQVEVAGSLFLPLFFLVARRVNLLVNVMVLAALVWLSWTSVNLYLIFLYCFYAGLILPQLGKKLGPSFTGNGGQVWLIIGIVILCMGYTIAGPQSLFGRVLIETLGSMLIICWLINPANTKAWFNRFLSLPIINKLGRYSYSFYLLHFAILYGLSYAMLSTVPADALGALPLLFGLVLICISVPLTYLLAGLSYNHVEMPMVQLAKRLLAD